jgi:hypothetical protein
MRTISSSSMAALIIVALFWGNCLSCPQMQLTVAAHQPAHNCCHRTKSAGTSCQSQGLQHFLKAGPGVQEQAAPVVVAAVEPAIAVSLPQGALVTPVQAEHAPPDLLSLHSIFRI